MRDWALLVVGTLLGVLSLAADLIGFGESLGLGWKQGIGLALGLGLVALAAMGILGRARKPGG
jgi:hypothetical protein